MCIHIVTYTYIAQNMNVFYIIHMRVIAMIYFIDIICNIDIMKIKCYIIDLLFGVFCFESPQ